MIYVIGIIIIRKIASENIESDDDLVALRFLETSLNAITIINYS